MFRGNPGARSGFLAALNGRAVAPDVKKKLERCDSHGSRTEDEKMKSRRSTAVGRGFLFSFHGRDVDMESRITRDPFPPLAVGSN